MEETLEKTASQLEQKFKLPEIPSITDQDILAYLRRSHKIAEVATLAQQEVLVISLCEKLEITVSDEEWQAAGNEFRLEHKLLGAAETYNWLSQQRITAEDWSQGIRVALLTKKLREHLFGNAVDSQYLNKRDSFKRVALSQILVPDLAEAVKVAQAAREEKTSFCALALEHSKGKQSKENGGFAGIRFVAELMPEIAQAISDVKVGEVLGPIQTKLGYHILKIEQWYPSELNESVREVILESLFQAWLHEQISSTRQVTPLTS